MSYSKIVSELQGDKDKAVKMLVDLSEDQKKLLKKLKMLKS